MAKVVGIRFSKTSKVYYFAPEKEGANYEVGSGVIVETANGPEYGIVAFSTREVEDKDLSHALKPVIRKATEKEKQRIKENKLKIPETLKFANEKIREMKLEMKLISAEYSFDGKKITFFFSSESRVDFRELVKVLASGLKARIELRQVGVRDETKMLGGIAPCGRTCCCAGTFSDFSKVTIKMAKNQGLHLNPSKISGLCGRLMCCLEYENAYYEKACKKVPKVGGTVGTPEGDGTVVSNDMLKMITKVKISKPDGSEIYKDFPVESLKFKHKHVEEPISKEDELDTIE